MRRFHLSCLSLLACLVAMLGSATVRASDPARLIPQEAAIYVEISDPARVVDRLLAPDILAMAESVEQFREFRTSEQFAQFRAVVTYLETKLGTEWRKAVTDLAGGGITLALRPGSPDFALLLIRAKDADFLRRANDLIIELAETDAKEKGHESPVKARDYKGVKAWSIGKDEFHAIIGDTLVFSNHQDGLKAVLELNAGEGGKPIAELAAWQQARSRQPADRVGWAFARIDIYRQAGVAKPFYEEKADNPALPLFFGGLSHVLREASFASGAITLNDDRLALRLELPRSGQSWPESLKGFYAAKPGEEAAVPLRPARTIASLSFYRDFKTIWDVRDQLVEAKILPQLTEFETNVGQTLFGGREFASEVLGEIEPRVRLVVAAQDFSRAKLVPDIKLPAFALVLELKHAEDFGQDLVIAYHSVLGLANIGLGQQNQPRFMLNTETHKGNTIQTSRFLDRTVKASSETGVHLRHNFSPSCSVAGRYFVLGSTTEIVKDVIDALGDASAPPKTTPHNILFETDVASVTSLLLQNKDTLISQNMLDNGSSREDAEQQIGVLIRLLGLFGPGRISWTAEPTSMHVDLSVDFSKPQKAAAK